MGKNTKSAAQKAAEEEAAQQAAQNAKNTEKEKISLTQAIAMSKDKSLSSGEKVILANLVQVAWIKDPKYANIVDGASILRDALMGDDATKWREIFLVPAIIGFTAVLLVVLFAKDTKVFINERIEYLSRPLSERQAEKELKKQQKEAQRNESGVFNGVKYIFANKDTKNLIISHIVFDTAMPAIALYFESSMHKVGMSTSEITKALFMVPVVYATITFLSGFIADKLGRKVTVTGFSITCISGYVLFVAGILCGWNPYLIGFFAGLYQGSYWIGRDYMNVMMTEKVPTDIRASVVGAEGLLVIIGLVVGYGSIIVGMMLLPIWWACLAISIPAVSIAAIMFALKVKETKGTSLDGIE